ncbi:MAG: RHS repeat-associated core domain-containing protein, partial [Mucilaginibacter sp.]
ILNQVTTTQQNNGTIRYAYDDLLRPTNVILNAPTFQSEVAHTYDVSGNLRNLTLVNEGKSLSYDYDELNRVTYIKDWNGNSIIHYNYLKNGLLSTAELSNGAVTHYHYDAANRLDSIYCVQQNSNTLLYAVGCSMDNNGNHVRESSFVNWEGPGGVPSPPVHVAASYDQYSRINTIAGQNVTSDNLGNIDNNPSSTFSNAAYDPVSQLISCTVDGENRQFLYDALGNRYGVDSMRYTVDALDNGNVLAERKLGQSLASQLYVHSPYGLVCSIDPQTATPTFYLYDFRGSTVATLGANAAITGRYKYDPWGKITYASVASGKNTPFLFVGQYGVMYESAHLYYMRARYYDPSVGRFLSEDSKWSTNLFSYAENNPINNIDPSGAISIHNVLDVIGFIPIIGEGANGVNALLYLIQGDKVNALLSGIALIPIAGELAIEGKYAKMSIEAANKLKVTGFVSHAVDRIIERKIGPTAILEAIKNPLKIGEVVIDKFGRPSQRFIGRLSEVVINPETGKIISVNPISSKKLAKLLNY